MRREAEAEAEARTVAEMRANQPSVSQPRISLASEELISADAASPLGAPREEIGTRDLAVDEWIRLLTVVPTDEKYSYVPSAQY